MGSVRSLVMFSQMGRQFAFVSSKYTPIKHFQHGSKARHEGMNTTEPFVNNLRRAVCIKVMAGVGFAAVEGAAEGAKEGSTWGANEGATAEGAAEEGAVEGAVEGSEVVGVAEGAGVVGKGEGRGVEGAKVGNIVGSVGLCVVGVTVVGTWVSPGTVGGAGVGLVVGTWVGAGVGLKAFVGSIVIFGVGREQQLLLTPS